MARIVFAPLGTLGDLHPSIAVARACAARGTARRSPRILAYRAASRPRASNSIPCGPICTIPPICPA
jgi:hypothetical protein